MSTPQKEVENFLKNNGYTEHFPNEIKIISKIVTKHPKPITTKEELANFITVVKNNNIYDNIKKISNNPNTGVMSKKYLSEIYHILVDYVKALNADANTQVVNYAANILVNMSKSKTGGTRKKKKKSPN
jgi:hypothetical protein